ncbi:hypothetical protein [Flavobacterium sp.]|uniref:hypothetical protein n=2 Tax=Flavobacterium sp. TaxID=239 RepID=UPI00404875E2
MAIIINFENNNYHIENTEVFNIPKKRGSELIKMNDNNGLKVCLINSNFQILNIYKNINGNNLFNLKKKFKNNVILAFTSIILDNINKIDFFIIESIGFDFKEIEDLKEVIHFFNKNSVKICFLIFEPSLTNFQIKI